MRVISVSGTRGSGKTTLIRKLIEHFSTKGKRCAVIVNEEGRTVYDEAFVKTHDLAMEHVRGG